VDCAFDEMVPIGEVKPYPRNPVIHPEKQIEQLAKIISSTGWRNPIVISRRSGYVVKGHGRLMAAQRLGMETVPVDWQDYSTDEEEKADRIADNKISELAEDNMEALLAEMQEINLAGADLELLGMGEEELDGLLSQIGGGEGPPPDAEPQIDKAEELREKWGVETGQLWQLGEHRILCGDSTDESTVKVFMSGEKADVVFTDPPYGVNISGGKNNSTIAGDITQTAIPFAFALACEIATTDDARLYFCGGEGNIGLYGKLFEKYCRQLPRHLIWVKNGFTMKPNGYHNQYEIVFHGYKPKGGGLNKWFGARTEDAASDVWQIKRDASATYLHPTQKPVDVPRRAIGNSCPPNGIVYEPFSGSASTLIACEQLGRKCRAIEISPGYVAVAIQRWVDATGGAAKLIG
jgi:hypothetical protein